MKKIILLVYFVAISAFLIGQPCGPVQHISISSQSIGNTGGYFTNNGVSLSVTIGSIMSETFNNENGTLTQGFQQSISLIPDISILPILCYGDTNGSVNMSIIGGIPPYTYQWWNSDTLSSQNNLSGGNYFVTIFDADGNSIVQNITIVEPDPISVVLTGTDVGNIIGNLGEIDVAVSGGSGTYFYNWSNNATTGNLSNLFPGIYTVTITDENGCVTIDSISINDVSLPVSPQWDFTITSTNHTILILNTIDITINENQIESGDYIGIFYDSSGTLKCGGYIEYENIGNITISAWGDDGTTTEKDGFAANEEFVWKIWDASDNTEYFAEATYYQLGFSQYGYFVNNGMSGLASLIAITSDSQTLTFPTGWSIFSTYINPTNPDISEILQDIVSNVIIVKDDLGYPYWPQYGVDLIADINISEGYQIDMLIADTVEIIGSAIIPENTPLFLEQGWSMFSYLRTSPAPINILLSSINNSIIIVKDGFGNIYWPQYGVNLINTMKPGEGYQLNLLNSVTLTYPANQ